MSIATRRRALLGTALALPLAGRAQAQQARPITLVVPYAPGGGTDLTAREFAHAFGEALGGQTVVIENRGGAAGHIGSVGVARSRPDGTTLLFAVSTNLVVNPNVQRGEPNLMTALAPVAQVTSYQYVLVIDPRLPINTLQELIAYARSKPKGELTYSSGGVGNANHLAGVLFSDALGIEMEHVPYRGTGPALLDVVAGDRDPGRADAGAGRASRRDHHRMARHLRSLRHAARDARPAGAGSAPGRRHATLLRTAGAGRAGTGAGAAACGMVRRRARGECVLGTQDSRAGS